MFICVLLFICITFGGQFLYAVVTRQAIIYTYPLVLFQDDVKDEETGDQKLCTDCKAFFGDIVQQLTGNDTLVGISFYFSDTPIHVS